MWINVAKLAVTTETTRVVERARATESQILRLQGRLTQMEAAVVNKARKRGFAERSSDATTFLQGARGAK